MGARHRPRRRHLDNRLPRLEKRRSDRRVLSPIDRTVESEETLQPALDVDDVLAAGDANGAVEYLLDHRQRRRERDRRRPIRLFERDLLPGDAMGFAMTGKAGGALLGRDRSEAVDAHEMAQIGMQRVHAAAIVVENQPHHGAAFDADVEGQFVVRDRQHRPAIGRGPILGGPGFARSSSVVARRSLRRRRRDRARQKYGTDPHPVRSNGSHRYTPINRST